jgi:hypothetical protein
MTGSASEGQIAQWLKVPMDCPVIDLCVTVEATKVLIHSAGRVAMGKMSISSEYIYEKQTSFLCHSHCHCGSLFG